MILEFLYDFHWLLIVLLCFFPLLFLRVLHTHAIYCEHTHLVDLSYPSPMLTDPFL